MGMRKILTFDDKSLRKPSRTVTAFNGRLHSLLEDMAETLEEACGAGLAAPQVGVLRRVCIVDIGEGRIELMNPEIIHEEGEQEGPEGCLSLMGKTGWVKRPMKVRVRAQNRHGEVFETEGEGFLARAFCHEIDHLNGKLYTDISSRFMTEEELTAYYKERDGGGEDDGDDAP